MDERIIAMDRERREALASRDAVRYATLCSELGVEPELQDLYDQGLAEIEFCRRKIRELEKFASEGVKKPSKSKKRKYKIPEFVYRQFYEITNEEGINPNDIFAHIEEKREILREIMGYENLVVGKGKHIPIDDCSDERVGSAYRTIYATACKRLGKDY